MTEISGGAFLVARKVFTSRIWIRHPFYLKIWIWILGKANHSESDKDGRHLDRGMFTTTYDEIIRVNAYYHNRRLISPTLKQVRLILRWLVTEGMIQFDPIRTNELPNRGRHHGRTRAYIGIRIIIVNYDTYQDIESYRGAHRDRPSSQQGHNNNNVNNDNKELSESDFSLFYKTYPKHEGRKKALDAWQKLKPSTELLNTILEAIERQKVHKADLRAKGAFVPQWPMPATWLNGRRWEDEILDQISPEPTTNPTPSTLIACPRCNERVLRSDLAGLGCPCCGGTA